MNMNDWRFPMVCPACESIKGTPKRVSEWAGDDVTIVIECASCGHVWEMSGQAPELFQRKADRRQSVH